MSDFHTFVVTPFIFSAVTYWGLSGFWFISDIVLPPKWRIPGGQQIDWTLYTKSAIQVAWLHSITPFILWVVIPLWKYRGIDTTWESFFTIETLVKLGLCPVMGMVIFYIGHSIGHLTLFYKTVHKKHHEWIVPCAVAASYTTIYEYLFLNLPVLLLPAMILRINWNGSKIWFVIITIKVVNEHSGYTFFNISNHHTNHHKYQNYNYGSFFLDSVFHTIK